MERPRWRRGRRGAGGTGGVSQSRSGGACQAAAERRENGQRDREDFRRSRRHNLSARYWLTVTIRLSVRFGFNDSRTPISLTFRGPADRISRTSRRVGSANTASFEAQRLELRIGFIGGSWQCPHSKSQFRLKSNSIGTRGQCACCENQRIELPEAGEVEADGGGRCLAAFVGESARKPGV